MGIFTPVPHYAGKKFRNGVFTLETQQAFSVYTTPEFKNG